MMLESNVPLFMRSAREAYIAALGAPSNEEAKIFQLRARRLLRGAVRELQRETDIQYDWTLLRASEQEIGNA